MYQKCYEKVGILLIFFFAQFQQSSPCSLLDVWWLKLLVRKLTFLWNYQPLSSKLAHHRKKYLCHSYTYFNDSRLPDIKKLFCWVVEIKPIIRMWDLGLWGGSVLRGGFSKRSYPAFMQVSEKTTENYERLGRQEWPRIEPGTSRLPVWAQYSSAPGGTKLFCQLVWCCYMLFIIDPFIEIHVYNMFVYPIHSGKNNCKVLLTFTSW